MLIFVLYLVLVLGKRVGFRSAYPLFLKKIIMKVQEKVYTFTTRDSKGNDIFVYRVIDTHIKNVREYAQEIVGNSRYNEKTHTRVVLDFNQYFYSHECNRCEKI